MLTKLVCPFCNSDDVEKFSETHYMCRNCGVGNKGIPFDRKEFLEYIAKMIRQVKLEHPEYTNEQLVDKTSEIFHKIEGHPTRSDGYCEYCEKMK